MRYYQAREARKVLNVTPKQLKKLVDSRKLNRYTPPKGGRDVYSKDEVDALARADREFWGVDHELEEEQKYGRAARGTVDDSSRSQAIQC